jgi:alkylmercury lyase
MKIKLHPSTRDAFVAIISALGEKEVYAVFQQFLDLRRPISAEELASIMSVSVAEAIILAKNKGELNDQGELVGFLGFSLVPTNHQFLIDGKKFYTWCAADTLVFPAVLGVEAEIFSTDPLTGEAIQATVDKEYLTAISPHGAMISWIDDVDDSDIRCSMCNRVHFFASGETVNKWLVNNKEARIFAVTDFFGTDISSTPCC